MELFRQKTMKSDYLIANSGTQIFDCAGELLFRLSIPHEIGFKLLRQFYISDGYYLFFYDLDRNLECGVFNGTTLLCNERSLRPIPVPLRHAGTMLYGDELQSRS